VPYKFTDVSEKFTASVSEEKSKLSVTAFILDFLLGFHHGHEEGGINVSPKYR
jgi:hypothetical protein